MKIKWLATALCVSAVLMCSIHIHFPPNVEEEASHQTASSTAVGSTASTAIAETKKSIKVALPLLLTHGKYHGTSLLATTIRDWVTNFLVPQGNIELLIFHDQFDAPHEQLSSLLGLSITSPPPSWSAEDVNLSQPISFVTMPRIHDSFVLQLLPITLPMPTYATSPEIRAKIANASDWMTCGCPPYCPARRASVQYVQGTRWYTYQLFTERRNLLRRRYDYWIKLDVDIWFYRPAPFNLGQVMAEKGATFAHTGTAYNGHGCSDELNSAITAYCSTRNCPMKSKEDPFWQQDDDVFYSNFVMSSVKFHTAGQAETGPGEADGRLATPFGLARFLNEYPTGFFKHRWTDQSLFHKVFGVFLGPTFKDYALDWRGFRCEKKSKRPRAIFFHGKGGKKPRCW
jgi:hypothetical protein